ncbi:MAG: NADAR family protein [Cyclobacteriaceae bacterium]|nr:NADAR family protein [Cyclobacteriaceae bacterium]
MKKYSNREYKKDECCIFSSTKKDYGGLSNMCSGFNLNVNQIDILTSEALYQALRFPDFPDIQSQIIQEKSPMTAKMVSKKHIDKTRSDWDNVKVDIMRWCLKAKLAQNFLKFGLLLESTNSKPIVEYSKKDGFWGAIPAKNNKTLTGINALGRLLMELRADYNTEDRFAMLIVEPLSIESFNLISNQIGIIDERNRFIEQIMRAHNVLE